MVREGKAVALKSGRPHYDVSPEILAASNDVLAHALALAYECRCALQVHAESGPCADIGDMARKAGVAVDRVVKHYGSPDTPLHPSLIAKHEAIPGLVRSKRPFTMESDYMDENSRPGAVIGPKSIPGIPTSSLDPDRSLKRTVSGSMLKPSGKSTVSPSTCRNRPLPQTHLFLFRPSNELSMFLKIHRSPGMGDVVAVCDRELINTTISHDRITVTVTEAFYGNHLVTESEVRDALIKAGNINLMGERVVALAIELGLISRSGCIMIGKVPHAQNTSYDPRHKGRFLPEMRPAIR